MFKSSQSLEYIDAQTALIQLDQEQLFFKYTGLTVDLNKMYHSLFRNDKNPGCRFIWHSGILYFKDNATYNNKLYFNVIDTLSILKGCSFQQALHLIIKNSNVKIDLNIQKAISFKDKVQIKFSYTEFDKENYFKLSPEILKAENVYKVSRYWIYNNNTWDMNNIYNPNKIDTYAYHFPNSNNVKLYFPNTSFRFFTNCDENDVYGGDELENYYECNPELLIITKSQKDRLLLTHMYGYNAIAPQSETNVNIPINYLNVINKFHKVIILFDNDDTGIKYSSILSEKLPNSKVEFLELAKDIYDATIISKSKLQEELCQKVKK
jgi:5S rRNA maturation endonuclease (ribonuclease M5)